MCYQRGCPLYQAILKYPTLVGGLFHYPPVRFAPNGGARLARFVGNSESGDSELEEPLLLGMTPPSGWWWIDPGNVKKSKGFQGISNFPPKLSHLKVSQIGLSCAEDLWCHEISTIYVFIIYIYIYHTVILYQITTSEHI